MEWVKSNVRIRATSVTIPLSHTYITHSQVCSCGNGNNIVMKLQLGHGYFFTLPCLTCNERPSAPRGVRVDNVT